MNWLFVFLSMTPFGELRAGLPVAVASGIPVWLAFFLSVFANFLVVPVGFLFLEFVHFRLLHRRFYRSLFDRVMERARHKHHENVARYGYWALFLLVAVPLPFTGAYTATLLAWFFGMDKFRSALMVLLGLFVAALVVLSVTLGGISLFASQ